jgi:hypothetical protein
MIHKAKQIKIGPFITQVVEHYNDSHDQLYTSRRIRKDLGGILIDKKCRRIQYPLHDLSSLFTYKPQLLTWWIGVLFIIGSACFMAGSIMYLHFEASFSTFSINLTFFIGSLFFTSAAYGQYLEAINADISNEADLEKKDREWIWFAWRAKNLGFLSSVSQLIGTLLFNIDTFDGLLSHLTTLQEDILIWVPNMIGSFLFLTASFFAWLEVYQDKNVKAFISVTWWIIWINILGSVFFQLSALKSYINLESGEAVNGILSSNYTLYGAACFLIGAYLLIVEMNESKRNNES